MAHAVTKKQQIDEEKKTEIVTSTWHYSTATCFERWICQFKSLVGSSSPPPLCFSRERPSPPCYLAAVTVVSASLNLRKFFELRLSPDGSHYETTSLMESQVYLQASNAWQELLVTGLVPIVALVYCNLRIYCKIRESSQHEKHRWVPVEREMGGRRVATLHPCAFFFKKKRSLLRTCPPKLF